MIPRDDSFRIKQAVVEPFGVKIVCYLLYLYDVDHSFVNQKTPVITGAAEPGGGGAIGACAFSLFSKVKKVPFLT
jgi:hypothetical protein